MNRRGHWSTGGAVHRLVTAWAVALGLWTAGCATVSEPSDVSVLEWSSSFGFCAPEAYCTTRLRVAGTQAVVTLESRERPTLRSEAQLTRGEVPNCVNVAKKTPARFQLIVRHYDKVGVLANVLGELREAGINAQELENTIFEGNAAACCWRKQGISISGIRRSRCSGSRMRKSRPKTAGRGKIAGSRKRRRNCCRSWTASSAGPARGGGVEPPPRTSAATKSGNEDHLKTGQ